MGKYIIREIPAEEADLNSYFDNDGLTSAGGDYCYNLFIIGLSRYEGFNDKAYREVQKRADNIIDAFAEIERSKIDKRPTYYASFREAMRDNGMTNFSAKRCHALREWAKTANINKTEDIAEFLTIETGKKWDTSSAHGYCQGDYVKIVYCPEYYPDGVQPYGEVWLGAAKEFCVIDLDDNGEEVDACFGFIVADCQAKNDSDYKLLVSEQADIDPEEATLEMIDGQHTYVKYTYRRA